MFSQPTLICLAHKFINKLICDFSPKNQLFILSAIIIYYQNQMLRKTYDHSPIHSSYQDRKPQLPNAFKTIEEQKLLRPQPFRNTSNHDSIAVRLEQIKKKYTDASKPVRSYNNNGSSRDRGVNQNRETLSQIKPKPRNHMIESPQKSVNKTRIQITSKIPNPYGSTKQKSFERPHNMEISQFAHKIQNFGSQQDMINASRYMERERGDSIQKINGKINNILEEINTGKKDYTNYPQQIKQISIRNSPQNQKKSSPRLSPDYPQNHDIRKLQRLDQRSSYSRNVTSSKRERCSSTIVTQISQKFSMKASSIIPASTGEKKKLTGKELDEQILRIQERIKKSSDERQRLSEMLEKKDCTQKRQSVIQKKDIFIQKKIIQYVPKTDQTAEDNISRFGKFEQKIYSIINSNSSENKSSFNKQSTPINRSPKASSFIDESKYNVKAIPQASSFSLNVMPVPCDTQRFNEQTHKLAMAFSQQVKADQQLRNGRIWLQHLSDPSKWARLKDYICRAQNRNYGQNQIKQIFKHTEDEHNPFFTPNPSQSIEGVVEKYLRVQNLWNKKIANKFSIRKLKEQGFRLNSLDLEEKGHIQMEDLVRFLNIETGNFYRNRDVVVIFKRMSRTNKLSFEEFMRIVGFS